MSVADESENAVAVPLLVPADGVPPVLDTAADVADAAARLAAGSGPLAVDAERASGFRYSNRAYLIQLRRNGSGSFLIDPIPVHGELGPLAEVINELEWVLHSADQDLPGLAELGLRPARLFDTELGGRLAGFERVGLAAMVERLLGRELRKGHGAADWSTRPLPADWLNYAALDVELLLELRDAVAGALDEQGKTDWAAQEFEHIRRTEPNAPKADRWRRTSGIHTLRRTRQLAVVRELWTTRDELARGRDVAPARILPDSAIIAAAEAEPKTIAQLRGLPVFGGPRQRRYSREWLGAVERARTLPDSALPTLTQSYDGPPPVNRWERRDPEAAARLTAARTAMASLSEQHAIPVENLLTPDLVRRLCWDGLPEFRSGTTPDDPTAEIDDFLKAGGARPWQRELAVPQLAKALFGA
ncbi:ribonuclease D [Nocardia terpenica]|uniref:HRDC domain-containing protein n=1 Tax=Nocardia terpenica TaxID=455432 RepID=UPI0018942429|nr:ribonuclease D [Nocardia terpenica]MBF6065510.1 ribonuclease D [Nocardia terpenica]MBF6108688.1 ribonuclease D [Nocardia terpenica]MBF6115718.1 ribonuclease D [Nocardia terpenica]MBF6122755.1 ribonuclease D [Nocardia terpenica]MBF6155893.1 ribonuclease D [Nocardia terpenica]